MKKQEFDDILKGILNVPPPEKKKHKNTRELQLEERRRTIEQIIGEIDTILSDTCKKYLKKDEMAFGTLYTMEFPEDMVKIKLVTLPVTPLKTQHHIREVVTEVLKLHKLID